MDHVDYIGFRCVLAPAAPSLRATPVEYIRAAIQEERRLARVPVMHSKMNAFTMMLAGLLAFSATAGAGRDLSTDARRLLEEGRTAGALPAGVVVRVCAELATAVPADPKLRAAAEARGVDFSKRLDERWEFTADRVYRVVMEEPPHQPGEKFDLVDRRVESRPFDSKALCQQLLEGKSLEIGAREGQGEPRQFVGTQYNIGGRSIEILRGGTAVLLLLEYCAIAGYPESDARAFAALYERLASQARELFKTKPLK